LKFEDNDDVKAAFHLAFFQGEDQAKAVIKGDYAYSTSQKYLIFVGLYWTPANYGHNLKSEPTNHLKMVTSGKKLSCIVC
jgi:hypothetical protein